MNFAAGPVIQTKPRLRVSPEQAYSTAMQRTMKRNWNLIIGLGLLVAGLAVGLPQKMSANEPTKGTNATELATYGGGCFWCVEAVFQRLDGVKSVVSGYAGGKSENPTYQEVC